MIFRHGYEAVTLRQIGRAAGIKAGSLYYYVNSKQDLLFRILKETLEEDFAELAAKVSASDDPASRLAIFIEVFVRGIIGNKKVCFIWTSEIRSLTPRNHRVIVQRSRQFVDCLRGIIEQGTDRGLYIEPDIEGAVFAIWSLLSSPLLWLYPARHASVPATVAFMTRLSFRCLGADPDRAQVGKDTKSVETHRLAGFPQYTSTQKRARTSASRIAHIASRGS